MPSTTQAAATTAEDTFVVCHEGPVVSGPSLSNFVLKLQTYLRMTEISFKQEFTFKSSSKGKVPYIKIEGKEMADTNFIIPYLNKKYEKDLDAKLSAQDQAVSLAFKRLIEENLYWTLVYYRWIDNPGPIAKMVPTTGLRKRLFPLLSAVSFKPTVKSNLQGHGMGRHSKEEIYSIMEKDLKALSDFLGEKEYMMGSEPSEIDATLFGCLGECLYVTPDCPHSKSIREKYENLLKYTDRMRERYWSDWDEMCFKEKKKEEEPAEKKENGENGAESEDKEVKEKKESKDEESAAGDAPKAEEADKKEDENGQEDAQEQKEPAAEK